MQGSGRQIFFGMALVLAGALTSGAAQARDVYWSVDVDAPVMVGGNVHTEFSNAPRVRYVQPQPVIVAPAPVVIEQPAPVYMERRWCPPRAVYVPARPVVAYPVYPGGDRWYRHHDWRHDGVRGWGDGWGRHERWEHEHRGHHGHDRD